MRSSLDGLSLMDWMQQQTALSMGDEKHMGAFSDMFTLLVAIVSQTRERVKEMKREVGRLLM